MPSFIGPRLDKVEIVRKVQKTTMLAVELALVKLCKAQGWKAPYNNSGNSINTKSVSLHEKWGDTVFHISLMWAYGNRFVIYMVIPDRMSAAEFAGLIELTESLGKASYREVLKYGYLRDIEVAIDFIGLHTSDYLFHRAGTHTSKHVCSVGQTAGTFYSGGAVSSAQLCAYNKSEQLIADGLHAPVSKLLRIEMRLSGQKISLADLMQLKNPFVRCWVCPRDALSEIVHWHTTQGHWLLFLKRCAANGVAEALNVTPSHLAHQFRKLLKDNQASWWHPETSWPAFGATALKQLQAGSYV